MVKNLFFKHRDEMMWKVQIFIVAPYVYELGCLMG